jgi:hypothetical protein
LPADESSHPRGHFIMARKLTLPDDKNPPAKIPQHAFDFKVSRHIRNEFLFPEGNSRAWGTCAFATWMPVPEATVDENNDAPPRQGDIWFTRQVCSVKSEAEAKPMQQFADSDLWLGVGALHAAHHRRPDSGADFVHPPIPGAGLVGSGVAGLLPYSA